MKRERERRARLEAPKTPLLRLLLSCLLSGAPVGIIYGLLFATVVRGLLFGLAVGAGLYGVRLYERR